MKNPKLYAWLLLMLPFQVLLAQGTTVGILDFENKSGEFYLDKTAENIPVLLKTELSKEKGLVLVERQNMQKVLTEQDFLLSDLVENQDAQEKLGKLLDAEFLITGSVSRSGKKIRIDASLVQVKTGKVVAEKVISPSKEYLSQMVRMLAQNLNHHLTGNTERREQINISGFPTIPFWLSTAGLLGGAIAAQAKYNDKRNEYLDAKSLGKIESTFDDANTLAKTRTTLFVLAGVSATVLVYGIMKNVTSDRRILAATDPSAGTRSWGLAAAPEKDGVQVQLTIRF